MAGDPPQFRSFTNSQIHRNLRKWAGSLVRGTGCKELHSCTVSQGNLKVWLGGGPETQILRSQIAGSLFPVEKGEEQRSLEEALESSSRQKEAATRIGIAAFLFLCLIPVYALEGYWTARVREEFESLVTSEFRFGKAIQSTELFFTEGL